ncbi:hypothetical protein KUTeg_000051 [Tegillarca granosa]|uniref:Mediator of RNA polymerase II transcription subunit 30 n=1 Tax=Tegillarca granosa TaxID=220873 RepID=A0ABQ9F6F6_TEGGR|nr:hypothetical protein KUTeg_010598 [Tegillarca granosa]KAJ8322401.1 hypothetical protein KUTeg_000051 [Tegillarca granosa]
MMSQGQGPVPPYPGSGTSQGGQGQTGQSLMQQPPPPQQSQSQPQMASPTKELNSVTLCKRGQEAVQDLVQKVTEIFKQLQSKTLTLPNGINYNNQIYQDRKAKLEEQLGQLKKDFKKLRLFYDKLREISGGDVTSDEPCYLCLQQLQNKNRYLKEIIDQMRTIIWEINTMIVMRKT